MPSYRRTLPRIEWGTRRTLFRYVVGDDLTLAGAVFARTGEARYVDANGVLQTAASGVVRDGHYVNGERTLLLEPASTNLCIRSEEFDTWSAIGSTTVTANAIVAPDGATTADLITCSAAGPASAARFRVVTFTGDGEKCVAIYLKVGNGAETRLLVQDATTATTRHHVRVVWTAGVPALSTNSGAGTLYPVEALANGWYRIMFSATGIVAANTNELRVYVNNIGAGVTGDSVYAWGAQPENAVVPSSYIPTEASTVTRAADSLYFPFTAPPQEMTIYTRQINVGNFVNTGAAKRYLQFGASSIGTDPRLIQYGSAGGTAAAAQYDDGTTVASDGGAIMTPVLRDVVEARTILSATWTVRTWASKNGASEVSGAESVASGPGASWGAGANRLYLAGLSGGNGISAFTHVVIAAGVQTMARLRAVGSGDDLFENLLTIAYPLDEAVSFGIPQEGSQMVFTPSGEADGWDAGETHVLEGVIRWIPRENTVTPAATGWDGAAGWRAFLAWARRGNPFWYCPDASDLSTGWTMYLEGPFNEAPTIEADMTRAVRVRFRSTVPIEGY